MGIFSKKKKVYVGTALVPLYDEIPDVSKNAIVGAIFREESISKSISREVSGSFVSRTNGFYRYGRNQFYRGLPEGYMTYSDIDYAEIAQVLSRILSFTPTVQSAEVSTDNYEFISRRYIQTNWGYLAANNRFNSWPTIYPLGTVITLDTLTLNEETRVTQVKVAVQKQPLLSTDPMPALEFETKSFVTPILDKLHLYVKYIVDPVLLDPTNLPNIKYWYYDISTNTYPEINKILQDSYSSPFYPIVPIRKNKVNIIDGINKDNTVNILDKLGINLSTLTDGIMSTQDGNNPDNIDDVFLTFAISMNTQVPEAKEYLFEFFLDLYNKSKVTKDIFTSWEGNKNNKDNPQEAMEIKEDEYNTTLVWNYVDGTVKAGNIGKVGTVGIAFENNPRFTLQGYDYERSKVILTKQIAVGTVQEIVVHGLEHMTNVYEGNLAVITVNDLVQPEEDRKDMYIPISREILNRMKPLKKAAVLYAGLSLVVYSVQIVYVKWYQRGFFRTFLMILIVVVSIYFGDWSGTFAQGFWAATASILSNVISNAIILRALQELVELIGGELALVLSVALASYAISQGYFSAKPIPLADDFMKLALLNLDATSKVYQEKMIDLQSDVNEFMKTVKEKEAELKEANDLLKTSDINYLFLKRNNIYFDSGESPSMFYTRMIHEKNPGVLVKDFLAMFYENKLNLQGQHIIGNER